MLKMCRQYLPFHFFLWKEKHYDTAKQNAYNPSHFSNNPKGSFPLLQWWWPRGSWVIALVRILSIGNGGVLLGSLPCSWWIISVTLWCFGLLCSTTWKKDVSTERCVDDTWGFPPSLNSFLFWGLTVILSTNNCSANWHESNSTLLLICVTKELIRTVISPFSLWIFYFEEDLSWQFRH